jgi:hypothetical protein
MHRTIAVLLFTIMCCFAAANIASAKSNKPNVDLTYGYEGESRPLLPGTQIYLGTESVEVSVGTKRLTCGWRYEDLRLQMGFWGTVLTNDKPTDRINITEVNGLSEAGEGYGCWKAPDPEVYGGFIHLNPWRSSSSLGVVALSAGKVTFRPPKTSPMLLELRLIEGGTEENCTYRLSSLQESEHVGSSTPQPLTIHLENLSLKLDSEKSEPSCPHRATFFAFFQFVYGFNTGTWFYIKESLVG